MPDASDAGSGNGKTLVIVESGAKADTISRFLDDDDYVVSACFGHVRDLPRRAAERPAKIKGQPWADLAVDVDHGFQPYYIVPNESKKHVTRLRKELRQADRVLLATDEDREGESIGWHLLEVLKPKVPYERIVFHEITPTAIEQAL
ncbi:MAG: DNA topoisomerase I, partial [Chloroflexi bacterium]|nr:DNA topoisomerase I [Chloroflexota bacterium]